MSEDYIPQFELSKRETNDLFRLVEQSRFPIVEFDLARREISGDLSNPLDPTPGRRSRKTKESIPAELITVIRHRPTKSHFGITKRIDTYDAFENVAAPIPEGRLSEVLEYSHWAAHGGWSYLLSKFPLWLVRIQGYIEFMEEPDLWSELARFRELLTATDFENTPFTRNEKAAISVRIQQAKEYVRTSGGLTSEQVSRVEARLDHAGEASERIGRKDWLMMVTGS